MAFKTDLTRIKQQAKKHSKIASVKQIIEGKAIKITRNEKRIYTQQTTSTDQQALELGLFRENAVPERLIKIINCFA